MIELPADTIQRALTPALQTRFGPVLDRDVLPGDEYKLYEARRFNDTPILVGSNADEGLLFEPPGMTPARFTVEIRANCGPYADAIWALYPHATEDEAKRAAGGFIRDALHGWMSSYWVNFARTGDPNTTGLPAWPAFGVSSQKAMYLDAHASAHAVPNLRQIKVLDGYFAWLRQESSKSRSGR